LAGHDDRVADERSPLEQVGDRLYALPPDKFIAARDEAVAAARESGDRDTADAIAALRKPTVAAWLVNLLALRRPDLLDELFELGAGLRQAQHELQGEQLRELSNQRRGVVSSLTNEAGRLAREELGGKRENLPLSEVEVTLSAALADEEAAQRVREGRLQRSTSYTGFGEAPKPQLRVIAGGEEAATKRPARPSNAEQELAAARTRAEETQAELDRATADEEAAAAALTELAATLDDLRKRYAAAQATASEVQLRRKSAQRAAQQAARQLTTAQQRVDRQNR
jgi:chromosome segregation ATPase